MFDPNILPLVAQEIKRDYKIFYTSKDEEHSFKLPNATERQAENTIDSLMEHPLMEIAGYDPI